MLLNVLHSLIEPKETNYFNETVYVFVFLILVYGLLIWLAYNELNEESFYKPPSETENELPPPPAQAAGEEPHFLPSDDSKQPEEEAYPEFYDEETEIRHAALQSAMQELKKENEQLAEQRKASELAAKEREIKLKNLALELKQKYPWR